MSNYIHFTDEQKYRANSVNLEEFLRRQGEELLPAGRDKRLASDHSILVRGNQWFDHGTEEGGLAIDFVQMYYDLPFPDAVTRLLGGETGEVYERAPHREPEPSKPFELPPAHSDMRRVFAYLTQHRHISRDVVAHFARAQMIYQSAELSKDKKSTYHNAVFVGYDKDGVACHAHKGGIYTAGKRFRSNTTSSDPAYSFHHIGTSGKLFVFEAPIDMLSYITLHPHDWQRHSYVALCGVAEHAMLKMLEQLGPDTEVVLCLDHDVAGIEGTGRLTEILNEKGYWNTGVHQPEYKDWNEDVKASKGLPAEPAEEHPQLSACPAICRSLVELCKQPIGPGRLEDRLPVMAEQLRSHVHWGRFEQAQDCAEQMCAIAMRMAARQHRQLGEPKTAGELAVWMHDQFQPHQNRGRLKNRVADLRIKFQAVLAQAPVQGIHAREDKLRFADACMDYALDCFNAAVRLQVCSQDMQTQQQNTGLTLQ